MQLRVLPLSVSFYFDLGIWRGGSDKYQRKWREWRGKQVRCHVELCL
jgi:hypothetical protein